MGEPLPIRYSGAARADLDAIYRYIAKDNPLAAIDVITAIEAAVLLLSRFPEKSRRTRQGSLRAAPLGRYPYIVFFRVRRKELYVLHILHGARRHPGFQDEQRVFRAL